MFGTTNHKGLTGCLIATVALSLAAYAPVYAGGSSAISMASRSLRPNVEIQGVVSLPDGSRVARATVKLITTSRDGRVIVFSTSTNVRGGFSLRNAPPGRYTVVAEARGLSGRNVIIVRPGSVHFVKVVLFEGRR